MEKPEATGGRASLSQHNSFFGRYEGGMKLLLSPVLKPLLEEYQSRDLYVCSEAFPWALEDISAS